MCAFTGYIMYLYKTGNNKPFLWQKYTEKAATSPTYHSHAVNPPHSPHLFTKRRGTYPHNHPSRSHLTANHPELISRPSIQISIQISSHSHPFRSLLRAIHLDLSTKSSIQISHYAHPIPISTHCYDPSISLPIAIYPDLISLTFIKVSHYSLPARSLLTIIHPDFISQPSI